MSKPTEYTKLLENDTSASQEQDSTIAPDFDDDATTVNNEDKKRALGYASSVDGPEHSTLPSNYQSSSLRAFVNVTKGV